MRLNSFVTIKMFALVKCLVVLTAAVAAYGFNLQEFDVTFHVLTRQNPQISQALWASPNSIMQATTFSPSRPSIFTIHSENDNVGGNFNAFMVPSYLAASDVNVVAVDWSIGANMYSNALGNVPQVAEIVARFINILNDNFGYGPSNIRIVGFGLGAHIAGIAARSARGPIPRILAIDPALHGWTHHPLKLNSSDATSVEVLHATAGQYGYDLPLGDIDFYPNGGSNQVGCGTDVSCSQVYSYAFLAESVTQEVDGGDMFIGTACESYEEAVAQNCSGERDVHFGGTEDKIGVTGIYWFPTNPSQPFARG